MLNAQILNNSIVSHSEKESFWSAVLDTKSGGNEATREQQIDKTITLFMAQP